MYTQKKYFLVWSSIFPTSYSKERWDQESKFQFHNLFNVLFLSFSNFFFSLSAVTFLSPACFFAMGPSADDAATSSPAFGTFED